MKLRKPTIFTTGQVAKLCAVSIRTVARWIEMGHLKAFRLPGEGSEFRVVKDDLLTFLKEFNLPSDHISDDKGIRVLILEPDQRLSRSLVTSLEETSFDMSFQHCTDVMDALINIGALRPQVIIADLDTAEFQAVRLFEYLQGEPGFQDVKFLFLGGDDATAAQLEQKGVSFQIPKPIKYGDFTRKAIRLLKKVPAE